SSISCPTLSCMVTSSMKESACCKQNKT
ncbi:unnamed protein product, partial [Arabidopsis lyrata]